MEWDALLLSRLQFAFTIAFHIIFPSFTIGLASYLAVLEGLWLKTKNPAYKSLYFFWLKIFALAFLGRCGWWPDRVSPADLARTSGAHLANRGFGRPLFVWRWRGVDL